MTKEVAQSYIWWPKIDKDIENTVRNCTDCQQVRNPPAVAPLTPWMWPATRPCRPCKGKQNFLIIVDIYTILGKRSLKMIIVASEVVLFITNTSGQRECAYLSR